MAAPAQARGTQVAIECDVGSDIARRRTRNDAVGRLSRGGRHTATHGAVMTGRCGLNAVGDTPCRTDRNPRTVSGRTCGSNRKQNASAQPKRCQVGGLDRAASSLWWRSASVSPSRGSGGCGENSAADRDRRQTQAPNICRWTMDNQVAAHGGGGGRKRRMSGTASKGRISATKEMTNRGSIQGCIISLEEKDEREGAGAHQGTCGLWKPTLLRPGTDDTEAERHQRDDAALSIPPTWHLFGCADAFCLWKPTRHRRRLVDQLCGLGEIVCLYATRSLSLSRFVSGVRRPPLHRNYLESSVINAGDGLWTVDVWPVSLAATHARKNGRAAEATSSP